MTAAIGRLWRDRSGVTAIVVALAAVVLIGFTGLGIDVVTWELAQRKMQSAADAAALSASIADYTSQNVTDAADAVTASYGYANGQSGTSVMVTQPTNEVKVVISQPQPQFFSRLFLGTAPTVTVQATANLPAGEGDMCVMTLDPSGKLAVGSTTISGTANVNMSTCDLYNNSTAVKATELNGSSTLDVRNMYLAGDYTTGGNATLSMTGTAATYVTPADDPYAGMSIPSYSGCNYGSLGSTSNPSANLTLTPVGTTTPFVICGGLHLVSGVTLTLPAGIYIIDSGSLQVDAGASIQSTGTGGVTIILASSQSQDNVGTVTINTNSSGQISLTAPITGPTAGIAIWVEKVDQSAKTYAATDTFNGGATLNIDGVIYMPTQQIDYSGGSSQGTNCLQMIALTVTFIGGSNTYITQTGCSALGIPIKQPPLPPTLAG